LSNGKVAKLIGLLEIFEKDEEKGRRESTYHPLSF